MSIVRTYRRTEQDGGQRRLEYREAWFVPGEDGPGEFVVHHGRVGTTGTTAAEPVAEAQDGEELLATFAAQCQADGFAPLEQDQLARVEVTYRFKGTEPTTVETSLVERRRAELTNPLAWRGLGEVVQVRTESGQAVLEVETPHAAKAQAEIPAAAKHAGVQASRVAAATLRS